MARIDLVDGPSLGLFYHKSIDDIQMESIHFQDTKFFDELTEAFEKIRVEINKSEKKMNEAQFYKSDLVLIFTDVIKKYTNITVESVYAGEPAVYPPMINKNHIFYKQFMRDFFKDPLAPLDGIDDLRKYFKNHRTNKAQGTVDIRTGKVSGIYAELPVVMLVPYIDLSSDKRLSCRELAAIILHEVGHVYTFFEYVDRAVTSNQILFGMLTKLDQTQDQDKLTVEFVKYAKALEIDDADIETVSRQRDKRMLATIAMDASINKCRSELGGLSVYDYNDCEALADQFAMRLGAGAHCASGLDKIVSSYMGRPGSGRRMFTYAQQAVIIIFNTVLTSGAFLVIMAILIAVMLATATREEPYDRLRARFTRMKNEMIERIKDKTISEAEKTQLIADIETIDNLSKIYDDNDGAIIAIASFFRGSLRLQKKVIEMQKQLERIASNDLFVSAAKLSTV